MGKFLAALFSAALYLTPLVANASPETEAIMQTLLDKERARAAASPAYYIVEERYSIGGAAPLVFEKLSNALGYKQMDPEAVLEKLQKEAGISREQMATAQLIYLGAADLLSQEAAVWVGTQDVTQGVIRGLQPDAIEMIDDLYGVLPNLMIAVGDHYEDRGAEITKVRPDAAKDRADLALFGELAELIDTRTYDGHEVYFLAADNLNVNQRIDYKRTNDVFGDGYTDNEQDVGEYTIKFAAILVDTETYVIRGMIFKGVSKLDYAKKQAADFEIEQTVSNFTSVPNTGLYLPMKKTMRVRFGHLDDKDREKLEKAKSDLEQGKMQLKQQLDAGQLSQGQYDMIITQLNLKALPMIKQMESMAASEGVGVEATVMNVVAGDFDKIAGRLAELANVNFAIDNASDAAAQAAADAAASAGHNE